MSTWAEFAAAEPEFARFGADLIRAQVPEELRRDDAFTGMAFIAEARPERTPRPRHHANAPEGTGLGRRRACITCQNSSAAMRAAAAT